MILIFWRHCTSTVVCMTFWKSELFWTKITVGLMWMSKIERHLDPLQNHLNLSLAIISWHWPIYRWVDVFKNRTSPVLRQSGAIFSNSCLIVARASIKNYLTLVSRIWSRCFLEKAQKENVSPQNLHQKTKMPNKYRQSGAIFNNFWLIVARAAIEN